MIMDYWQNKEVNNWINILAEYRLYTQISKTYYISHIHTHIEFRQNVCMNGVKVSVCELGRGENLKVMFLDSIKICVFILRRQRKDVEDFGFSFVGLCINEILFSIYRGVEVSGILLKFICIKAK